MFRIVTMPASPFIVNTLNHRQGELTKLFPSTAERLVRLRAR